MRQMHVQVTTALEQRNLAVQKFDQAKALFHQIEAKKEAQTSDLHKSLEQAKQDQIEFISQMDKLCKRVKTAEDELTREKVQVTVGKQQQALMAE